MLAVVLVLYMACAYRYRGGWRLGTGLDSPRWLELLAVSWPMGLVAWCALTGVSLPVTVPPAGAGAIIVDLGPAFAIVAGLIVLLATAGAHSLGHGNAMNLGRRPYTGDERQEAWDLIAGPLVTGRGFDERWNRDAIALALSGLAVIFPTVVVLGLTGQPWLALLWTLAGAGKVVAYEFGWRLHVEGSRWRLGTEIGEVAWGTLLGAGVAAVIA